MALPSNPLGRTFWLSSHCLNSSKIGLASSCRSWCRDFASSPLAFFSIPYSLLIKFSAFSGLPAFLMVKLFEHQWTFCVHAPCKQLESRPQVCRMHCSHPIASNQSNYLKVLYALCSAAGLIVVDNHWVIDELTATIDPHIWLRLCFLIFFT